MSFSPSSSLAFSSEYSDSLLFLSNEDFGTSSCSPLTMSRGVSSSSLDASFFGTGMDFGCGSGVSARGGDACDGELSEDGCEVMECGGNVDNGACGGCASNVNLHHSCGTFHHNPSAAMAKVLHRTPLIERRNIAPPSPIVVSMDAVHTRKVFSRQSHNNEDRIDTSWKRSLLSTTSAHLGLSSVGIMFKSRRESFRQMESELYSTIKYEIHHVNLPANVPVRIRAELVNASTQELIVRKNNKETLSLVEEESIVNEGRITRRFKIQFKEISYRQNHASFALRLTYEHENTNEMLLQLESKPFKVFARRPDAKVPASRRLKKHRHLTKYEDVLAEKKLRKVGRKCKRGDCSLIAVANVHSEEDSQSTNMPPAAKRIRFGSFSHELNDLFATVERIRDGPQKQKALRLISERFCTVY
eukprot:CAMPEP_0117450046 /NCGR_PEP_ID=MMETSP0759-20121206/8262_1 /TAXON_ID=63605 /ORGANISM="Percolomonas cosmopolitus, Strain WS" /LENGTH=415 /DNA_ID=CAMNT_0005242547 /DNA_START=197 /DNA_END=1444 /DNA_ORIENTATION=-